MVVLVVTRKRETERERKLGDGIRRTVKIILLCSVCVDLCYSE